MNGREHLARRCLGSFNQHGRPEARSTRSHIEGKINGAVRDRDRNAKSPAMVANVVRSTGPVLGRRPMRSCWEPRR